jgi:hypothetical protein
MLIIDLLSPLRAPDNNDRQPARLLEDGLKIYVSHVVSHIT